MNNFEESFIELLHQCESGIKSFNDLLLQLKLLSGDKIVENLNSYFEERIKNLLDCNHLDNIDWQQLDNLQLTICKFLYKGDMKLSNKIEQFVHDFDRIDDPQMRNYIIDKLKNHKLSYAY